MIKTSTNFTNKVVLPFAQSETSYQFIDANQKNQIIQKASSFNEEKQQPQKFRLSNNLDSLNSKQEVESINSSSSGPSDDMDIDEENDIVNELSYFKQIQSADQEDEIFTKLSLKDRILYANTKKHQGNQFFKENNFQEAIQAYKFGLSLLKPQSFIHASKNDCLLMAELTSNILYNMGTCYFILMSYTYAIRFYDQAILIKPNYAKAIHNRALCYLEEGNILTAYNDIKLAFIHDQHNASIKNDLKRIQEEYFGSYGQQTLKQCTNANEEKKPLSKSMICETSFKFDHSDQVTASTIQKNQKVQNRKSILQITKIEEKCKCIKEIPEKTQPKQQKEKVKSFFGKNFYRNQVPKTPKSIKPLNSSMNSPKFRPFVLNKTLHNENKFQQSISDKKISNKTFEKPIIKEQQKEKFPFEPEKKYNQKKKVRKSRQKPIDDKDNYWGYIPIFVATGYGLYHSLRAVLGK